jgi:hypothetical protein
MSVSSVSSGSPSSSSPINSPKPEDLSSHCELVESVFAQIALSPAPKCVVSGSSTVFKLRTDPLPADQLVTQVARPVLQPSKKNSLSENNLSASQIPPNRVKGKERGDGTEFVINISRPTEKFTVNVRFKRLPETTFVTREELQEVLGRKITFEELVNCNLDRPLHSENLKEAIISFANLDPDAAIDLELLVYVMGFGKGYRPSRWLLDAVWNVNNGRPIEEKVMQDSNGYPDKSYECPIEWKINFAKSLPLLEVGSSLESSSSSSSFTPLKTCIEEDFGVLDLDTTLEEDLNFLSGRIYSAIVDVDSEGYPKSPGIPVKYRINFKRFRDGDLSLDLRDAVSLENLRNYLRREPSDEELEKCNQGLLQVDRA